MTTDIAGPGEAQLPPCPIAGPQADWRDVPKGFYAIPVHDWFKFGDDCGPDPDSPPPDVDLLGYALFTRKVPTEVKTGSRRGRRVGKDQFIVGRPILAKGVADYVLWPGTENETRRTPWQRLTQEIASDRYVTEHDSRRPGDTGPPCRCPDCRDRYHRERWKAVPNQREAYANTVAAIILDGIANQGDIYRKLYGQLTGQCGICGRRLTDPDSKLRGIGPECLRRAGRLAAALSRIEEPSL